MTIIGIRPSSFKGDQGDTITGIEEHSSIPHPSKRTILIPFDSLVADNPNVIAQIAHRLAGMSDLGLFLGEREIKAWRTATKPLP